MATLEADNTHEPDVDPMTLDASADLETVLGAWHEATVRLEHTHEALRAEVQRLTDELEVKNRELARENRLADLGRMASAVAHEVRNSLVPVTLYMNLLRRRIADDVSGMEILERIEASFTALDSTVNDLLHFTADRDPDVRTVAAAPLIHEIAESLAPQFAAQRIELTIDAADDVALLADREMLRRAMLNLMLNALDALPEGGTLTVTASPDEPHARITFEDDGRGFTPDALRHASEPFFSTKSTGTGLGLAIVFRTAEVHGGAVSLENTTNGGARVTIELPTARKEAA